MRNMPVREENESSTDAQVLLRRTFDVRRPMDRIVVRMLILAYMSVSVAIESMMRLVWCFVLRYYFYLQFQKPFC
jgi:hypothetical protein